MVEATGTTDEILRDPAVSELFNQLKNGCQKQFCFNPLCKCNIFGKYGDKIVKFIRVTTNCGWIC